MPASAPPHPANSAGEEALDESMLPFLGLVRYERQLPIRQISYYLSGGLLEAEHYTASETDIIYLHLNSPGGDFDTGLQIINNMLASSARVVTVLEARAYSMAAFIFLAGEERVVHDNCQLMFHIYSGSFAGKGNEQQAQVAALSAWFEKVMARLCSPFLSPAEIQKILKGSDIWMDSDEIRRRLHKQGKQQKAVPRPGRKRADEDAI
jgi:ATP-dependent Clp protease protease subunit